MQILQRTILTSGKFLSRYRSATLSANYSVGYSYSSVGAGVSIVLTNEGQERMELRLTPTQAEEMSAALLDYAEKTRVYQNESK